MCEDLCNVLCDMGVIPTPSTNRDPQAVFIFKASGDLRTILHAGQRATKNTSIQYDFRYTQQQHMHVSRGYCSTIIHTLRFSL